MHRAVLHSAKYIKYARENAVEVITMEEIDVAERKKSKDIRTYKTKDAYGDEVEYLAEFPGITMEELKRISADNAPPIEYMQGGKIPYHGFVDPHTMKEMESVRGKRSVAQMIALIEKHKKTLKEKHGAGIERKHWREAGKREIEIDLALAKTDFLGALKAHTAMALIVKRPAAALASRIESAYEVIEADLSKYLDSIETMDRAERKRAVKNVTKMLQYLESTALKERAKALAGTH